MILEFCAYDFAVTIVQYVTCGFQIIQLVTVYRYITWELYRQWRIIREIYTLDTRRVVVERIVHSPATVDERSVCTVFWCTQILVRNFQSAFFRVVAYVWLQSRWQLILDVHAEFVHDTAC